MRLLVLWSGGVTSHPIPSQRMGICAPSVPMGNKVVKFLVFGFSYSPDVLVINTLGVQCMHLDRDEAYQLEKDMNL